LKLRSLNKDKVILLCGNHEGGLASGRDTFIENMRQLHITTDVLNLLDKSTSYIGPCMLSLVYEGDSKRY
jgi:hypothetical protein